MGNNSVGNRDAPKFAPWLLPNYQIAQKKTIQTQRQLKVQPGLGKSFLGEIMWFYQIRTSCQLVQLDFFCSALLQLEISPRGMVFVLPTHEIHCISSSCLSLASAEAPYQWHSWTSQHQQSSLSPAPMALFFFYISMPIEVSIDIYKPLR